MLRVRNVLTQAETQNHQLLENIDFLKKQGPLVNEKLHLEDGNLKQIQSARAEVRTIDCVR